MFHFPEHWEAVRDEAFGVWFEERVIAFESYVSTFLKHEIHAKSFARCIATAIADSDAAPDCMADIEEIDADCWLHANTPRTSPIDRLWDQRDHHITEYFYENVY